MSCQGREQARALHPSRRAPGHPGQRTQRSAPVATALPPAAPFRAGQRAVRPAGAARGRCGPGRDGGGAARTLPRRLGRRPVPSSSAGKQTWPAREIRRTLRTTWAITCRSCPVTVRGRSLAAGGGEARAVSGTAGPGRRAGAMEPAGPCRKRPRIGPPARDPVAALLTAARSPGLGTRVWRPGRGVSPKRQGPHALHPPCVQNLAPRKWSETGSGEERGTGIELSSPDFSSTSSL